MPSELSASHDFVEVCDRVDLWDGEMQAFDVGNDEVLVVSLDGVLHAYHGTCPHQNISLVEGALIGNVLTCRAHLWQFDASTGRGINPATANLIRYPIEVIGGKVRIGNAAITESDTAPATCTGNCSK
jgi:toluene monooxygenase system ferredoxin subunit